MTSQTPPASRTIPADVKPIAHVFAAFTEGNLLRGRSGTAYLFPDRLVHVSARGAMIAFGLLGLLISRRRSEGRAHRGGMGVTDIPFGDIATVKDSRYGLSRDMIEIDTKSGSNYRLGVKFHKWGQPIRDAMTAQGLAVTDIEGGYQVS
jgi:hypothetical protein